jgi:sulfofructose kinase
MIIKMKVLGIGHITIDKIFILEDYPREGGKIEPEKVTDSIGGSTVNALVMLASLGVNCTLMASIGRDVGGKYVTDRLEEFGINFIPTFQNKTKIPSVIINKKNGSRTIIKDNINTEKIIDFDESIIHNSDFVLFDRHVIDSFRYVSNKKNESNKILIDPSIEVSERTIEMIEKADYPIITIEILEGYSDESLEENLVNIQKLTNKPLIITLGKYGTILFDGEIINYIPSFETDVIDTLGAGDVFRGVFTYCLLKDKEVLESIKFANAAASLQCTKIGGANAIPTEEEINEKVQSKNFSKYDLEDVFSDINKISTNKYKLT